jgi:energy-coupling factor transporter ATP-binding protein EcfA2
MSEEAVRAVADAGAFAPTAKPWLMSARHVPFDEVTREDRYESRVMERLARGEAVILIGESGAGKTSVASWVGAQLPDEMVAVRLLVSALRDPADVSEALKLALGTILDVIALDAAEREAIHRERSDNRTAIRAPAGITGGKLGGGRIPVQVDVEVGSLRQEFEEDRLGGEYVSALNRVVAILRERDISLVFVMDDAEAIVGGPDRADVVEGLLSGPARVLTEEIAAAFLLAIQPHLIEGSEAYGRLAGAALVVELPVLGARAPEALRAMLGRCLELAGLDVSLDDVVSPSALTGLVQFYDDTRGDLRKTLAAAGYAADDAASMNSIMVTDAHVRVGASQAL